MKTCYSFIFYIHFSLICTLVTSQTLPVDSIKHIKESTVFIEVSHSFPFVEEVMKYSGSGFFISSNGFLITNYHVVQPVVTAYEINFPSVINNIDVYLNSGTEKYRKYSARVVAIDKKNDVALLCLTEAITTPCLNIDYSEDLVESTPVWAFGFPLSEEFSVIQRGPEITVTNGSITSLRHDDRNMLNTIQLDAVVKPGNSGGPLVNSSGQVIGIVNLAMGETRFNFAVPAHFIKKLLEGINLNNQTVTNFIISVITEPAGTTVFKNGDLAGTTPISSLQTEYGLTRFILAKNGYETFFQNKTISSDGEIKAKLNPVRRIPISVSADVNNKPQTIEFSETGSLLTEGFDDQEQFNQWHQNTGGDEKRTWFLDKSTLNQFESDNLLHAITIGNEEYQDFMISARVRISDRHDDSRAGLTFSETENGFYVFRIHKESMKAQLAYHCKKPFGWFIIMEQPLDSAITNDWFRLKAINAGGMINCWFNDKCIISSPSFLATKGKIGFYSVESKASFDSLSVVSVNVKPASVSEKNSIRSFWFTDYFLDEPPWWYQFKNTEDNPDPWYFSDGGCALFKEDSVPAYNEFTKYLLKDFDMSLILTMDKGTGNSRFEIFFRKTADGMLKLVFDQKSNEVRLIECSGKKELLLKKAEIPFAFFNSSALLHLVVNGQRIKLETSDKKLIEYSGKNFHEVNGTFGFGSTSLRLVLHSLSMLSARG